MSEIAGKEKTSEENATSEITGKVVSFKEKESKTNVTFGIQSSDSKTNTFDIHNNQEYINRRKEHNLPVDETLTTEETYKEWCVTLRAAFNNTEKTVTVTYKDFRVLTVE